MEKEKTQWTKEGDQTRPNEKTEFLSEKNIFTGVSGGQREKKKRIVNNKTEKDDNREKWSVFWGKRNTVVWGQAQGLEKKVWSMVGDSVLGGGGLFGPREKTVMKSKKLLRVRPSAFEKNVLARQNRGENVTGETQPAEQTFAASETGKGVAPGKAPKETD